MCHLGRLDLWQRGLIYASLTCSTVLRVLICQTVFLEFPLSQRRR